MKICNACQVSKPFTDFAKDKALPDGLRRTCRECSNLRTKKWKLANKEQRKARSKEWKKANPDKVKQKAKNSWLRKRYGIDSSQYEQMLTSQSGKCLICLRHHSELPKALAVDHCHSTGKIRGLLCSTCNSFLGYIKDNPDCGINLSEYLRSNENTIS